VDHEPWEYQLQTGVELAEAYEVELELDTDCCEDKHFEDHERLEQTSPNSSGTDTGILVTNDLRLWMVNSLPNGNTF